MFSFFKTPTTKYLMGSIVGVILIMIVILISEESKSSDHHTTFKVDISTGSLSEQMANDDRSTLSNFEITWAESDAELNSNTLTLTNEVINYKEVKVRFGDTLTKIARENNSSLSRILYINNLESVDRIYAGSTLKIPLN